jgi:opacity protein-like surface antigen
MAKFSSLGTVAGIAMFVCGGAATAQEFEQDWEGFHAGVHLDFSNYSNAVSDLNNTFLSSSPELSFVLAHGGITVGYNYALDGNLIVGAELDWTSQVVIDEFFSSNATATTGVQYDLRLDGVTSLRGRAGFTQGNALSYVTIGYANAQTFMETYTVNTGEGNTECGNTNCANTTEALNGISVGAGVDWAFREDWVARVEVQHYAFESVQAPTTNASGDFICSGDDTRQCTVGYNPSLTSIRMGISYMF